MRAADAHGKHLFLGFAPTEDARPGHWLHVHLGLYGGWELQRHGPHDDPAPPRGAVRVRLLGDTVTADLRGPTACDVLNPAEKRAVHARLGADPLRPRSDPEQSWRAISRSRAPVGGLLMQQEVVAGVGNVYRAEVLFRARLDPFRSGREVTYEQWQGIWADLVTLMRAGVRAGNIVTTLPEHRARRSGPARREDRFYVYKRTGLPCRLCGTPVVAEPFVARTLYYCPTCQPAT
jgi:formamidopyrimidine-DNA glycosylase